jgi:hypothetical protein
MAVVFRGSKIYGDAGGTATASLLLVRSTNIIIQMIILIAPNYIGRDNTPVTIPRLAVG